MGMNLETKTKLRASLKLLNHINSFLFEQEYDELKHFTDAQKDKLKHAALALSQAIKKT